MLTLIFTYIKFKDKTETAAKHKNIGILNIEKNFWLYCLFIFFTTVGFSSFALIGYHLKTNNIFPENYIVTLYAIAMAVDGLFAILIGKIYDRFKKKENNSIFYSIHDFCKCLSFL